MHGAYESSGPLVFDHIMDLLVTCKNLHRGSGLFEIVFKPRCVRSRASVLTRFGLKSGILSYLPYKWHQRCGHTFSMAAEFYEVQDGLVVGTEESFGMGVQLLIKALAGGGWTLFMEVCWKEFGIIAQSHYLLHIDDQGRDRSTLRTLC